MRKGTIGAALCAVASFTAAMASAQDAGIGHDLFMGGCAACHGASGTGDGPVATFLNIEVPDLTTLSERNGGAFPMLEVIHAIDGRTGLRTHETSMPVFGAAFMDVAVAEVGENAAVLLTRGRILSLAMYLETIQK